MPKANDLEIYPFDPLIDPRDGVFGFDWNNAKRNRNFKMEHLRHFILQGLDPSNNGFITTTGYTLVGNLLTINAGWVWQLNGMLFTNEEEVVFSLEYTAEGFVRIDSIYANANNTFLIVSGPEDETIAVPPEKPVNTLLAFSINVFDTTIVGGEEPVLGNIYFKKEFHRAQIYNGSGSNVVIPLNPNGYSNIYLTGTITSVDGFDFSELAANPSIAEYPHEGKPFRIYNWTSGPVTLNHEITNPMFFQFRNASNFVLPVGESVELVNNSYSLIDVDKSFTTTDDVNGLQAELDLKLDIADYNDHYKGKYTSLVNLQAAHPTANDGDYAIVDVGSGSPALEYIWDTHEGWIQGNEIGPSTTDALVEGSSNLYFTVARVLATLLTGLSASSGTFTSSDSLLTAFGKIKYLIDNIATTYQAILVSGTNIKTINGSSILGSGNLVVGGGEDFVQSQFQWYHFTSFGARNGVFNGIGLASGTASFLGGSGRNGIANYQNIQQFNSSTSANSGYRIGTVDFITGDGSSRFSKQIGLTYFTTFCIYANSSADTIIRLGYMSSINTSAPTIGVFIEITGTSVVFKSVNNSITTTSFSGTLAYSNSLSTEIPYDVLIHFDSLTQVSCKIVRYDGVVVFNPPPITTNIPGASALFHAMALGVIQTAGTVRPIFGLQKIGIGTKKPSFLNSF